MTEQYYRWNVDPTWENISAAYEEAYHASRATNAFMRYRHFRALLAFASTGIEAFFNQLMRARMENDGAEENTIYKKLRNTKFHDKIRTWPSCLCQGTVELNADAVDLFDLFQRYYDLRCGLIHPKDPDHSVYLALEALKPEEILEAMRNTLLRVYEAIPQSWPYWLLGWNFVGFDRSDSHPYLSNVAQFRHSLARLGFIDPADAWGVDRADAWARKWMSDRKGFEAVKSMLDGYPQDIEPWFEVIPGMGSPPRLCRRWWDHEFIVSTVPGSARHT